MEGPGTPPQHPQEPPGGWTQPQPQPAQPAYAVKLPLGRVWGFSLLSFGLYGFYWVYYNRKLIDAELAEGRDDALFHTLGQLVPVLNIVIVYWIWRDINRLRAGVGLEEFSVPLYLVASIFGLGPIFYSLVVNRLNEFWDVRTAGLATDAPVATAEKGVVAAGAAFLVLWLLLIIVAIVIAIVAASAS